MSKAAAASPWRASVRHAAAAWLLSCIGSTLPADAQTVAGTPVTNTASLSFADAAGTHQVASNPVTFAVAERLDLQLAGAAAALPIAAGATTAAAVTLTNTGNGPEAFAVGADAGSRATVTGIAIDVDGDGRYDPARDTLLADGRTPVLAAGATVQLLIVLRADAAPAPGDLVTVNARAVTASGAPGTVAPGAGENGGDAVVGPTGAAATVTRPLVDAGTAAAAPTLAKSVTIVAPDGSARPVSGAAVTYALTAYFPTATSDARVDDAVPTGTSYRPGTLSLDDAPLTDAADDDAGRADARAVGVTLGAVAAGATHLVRFTVILP